jgi:hypothetical protein
MRRSHLSVRRLVQSGVRSGVATLAFATLAVIAAPTTSAAAAEAGKVEEVSLSVHPRKHWHKNVLFLAVYPQKGLATVSTVSNEFKLENRRGVAYAVAIPPQPFEGSLDVAVPGLGEFVGTVDSGRGDAMIAKRCSSGSTRTEPATFEGRIEFRGAGYGSWTATRGEAGITRSCGATTGKPVAPKELFSVIGGIGTMLPGPSSFRFFSRARDSSREFVAVGGRGLRVSMIAVDREWLPGEVATQRWVSRWGVPYANALTIGPGGDHPTVVTFHPSAPFFGTAVYRRASHSLSGSLGVNFPGLRMQLARPPLPAALEDEEAP